MAQKRIYLDYAATTPVDPEVVKAMRPYWVRRFGNPGSLHSFGREAQAAVDESRAKIAAFLGCQPREVIFTGSATEANNLAIRGVIRNWKLENRNLTALPHIITTAIEHESVLETCRDLEKTGQAKVTYVPVDRQGYVKLDAFRAALRAETVLVSVMYANNEIGTIQPIAKIAEVIRNWKLEIKNSYYPLFHTDAAQATQFLEMDVGHLGVDLMTISAHKIYGPKGIGALYARHRGRFLSPVVTGGGQEYGLRSGTENTPYIVGFAKAIELVKANRVQYGRKIKSLRDELWRGIMRFAPEAVVNSPDNALPNLLNVSFRGASGEELLLKLDRSGIAVSTGSACSSRALKPSHVLGALGLPEELIAGTIRFSLGRPTTHQEIISVIQTLKKIYGHA